jgi:hypothetical protein
MQAELKQQVCQHVAKRRLTVCRFLMAQRPLSSQPRLESRIGAKTTTKKTKYVEEPLPATLKAELTARVDGWQASLPATAAAF